MQYVIGWYSKVTEASGAGAKRFDFKACQTLCDSMNKAFPELEHFAVDPDKKTVPEWDNKQQIVTGAVGELKSNKRA